MKTRAIMMGGLMGMLAWPVSATETGDARFRMFSHPGIPVDGREGRTLYDNAEIMVIELKAGEAPLDYTLGPLKTSARAVIEYTALVALEGVTAETVFHVSLLARDGKLRELADNLGAAAPDFGMPVPHWQTLSGRAVMPEGTEFVEMRLHLGTPFKLYAQKEGIRSVGLWVPPDDPGLREKARISNDILDVVFNPAELTLGVLDKRAGKIWQTFPLPARYGIEKVRTGKLRDGNRVIAVEGVYFPYTTPFRMVYLLAPDAPLVTCRMEMSPLLGLPAWIGAVDSVPRFKAPDKGHQLVVPAGGLNLYPTDNPKLPARSWRLAENPAWFGVSEGGGGPAAMCIVSSFQHAELTMLFEKTDKRDGRATVRVEWLPHEGRWDYPREVQFWFSDTGGQQALVDHFYQRTY